MKYISKLNILFILFLSIILISCSRSKNLDRNKLEYLIITDNGIPYHIASNETPVKNYYEYLDKKGNSLYKASFETNTPITEIYFDKNNLYTQSTKINLNTSKFEVNKNIKKEMIEYIEFNTDEIYYSTNEELEVIITRIILINGIILA